MSDSIGAITMPKWGLAMEEGMVVAWLAEEGEAVEVGQEVLEIETSKITNVFESPVGGTLRRRVVAEGESVPVGALLGVTADESVDDAEIEAFVAKFLEEFSVEAAAGDSAPKPETVTVDGRNLTYLRVGEGDGPPLVLVHGFGGDHIGWMFNQTDLAQGRQAIALDLPGHGRSSKDVGAGDMDFLVATLAGFLDAVDVPKAHLAGHSMGGAISLVFALTHPDRVASVSALAPGGLGDEVNAAFIEGFIGAGRRKEMKAVLELLVADPALISRDMVNEVLKYKRLDGAEAALATISGQLFAGGRQERIGEAALSSLSAPVLLIWGKEDRVLPAAHADNAPASFRVELLDAVGHMPHMEAAAAVNRLIAEHIG